LYRFHLVFVLDCSFSIGKVTIYGATGYTGGLACCWARRTGLDFVLAGRTHSLVASTAAILDIPHRVFGLNSLELIVARASYKCHSESDSSGRTTVRRDACADAIRALLTSTLACGKLSLIAGIWRVKQRTVISLLLIIVGDGFREKN
jgi:hypothetical protein